MSRKFWHKILGLLVGLFNVNLGGFRGRGRGVAFGNALRNKGRIEEEAAVLAYRKAIQIAPDDIHYHIGLAVTYIMMGREKEACAEAAEVLRINPKFSLDDYGKSIPGKNRSGIDRHINNPAQRGAEVKP